jgi:hypothetical protein
LIKTWVQSSTRCSKQSHIKIRREEATIYYLNGSFCILKYSLVDQQ